MSDFSREFISQICTRDADAFSILYEKLPDKLTAHIRMLIHDDNAEEELCQETFLKIWQRIDTWQQKGALQAWIYKIATNLAWNYIRDIKKRQIPESHFTRTIPIRILHHSHALLFKYPDLGFACEIFLSFFFHVLAEQLPFLLHLNKNYYHL